MEPACAINHQRRKKGYPIGNNWYSNAMATGGESFIYSKDIADKISKVGYKITFFCWGRRSLLRKDEFIEVFKACRAKQIIPLLQQVHNLSAYNGIQLKEFSGIINDYAPLLSPVESFATKMSQFAHRSYYFPNAVDTQWIARFRSKTHRPIIVSDTFTEKDFPLYQTISNLGIKVQAFSRQKGQAKVRQNVIVSNACTQALFLKELASASIAISTSLGDSFGRFAIECAILGIPLVHFGTKGTANKLFPTLVSPPAKVPEMVKKLLGDKDFYSATVQEAAEQAKFFSLPSWQTRYQELLKKVRA